MKPTDVLPISTTLNAIGSPIAYYPIFAKALGGVKSAIFLSQFMYWDGKQENSEGWIYKTQQQLQEETGLTRTEQENARNILQQFGVLEEKKFGMPAKLHFRFNWNRVDEILTTYIRTGSGADKTQPEIEKKDPLLYRMKCAFDSAYSKPGTYSTIFYEIPFAWSKANKGGKDWNALKQISVLLRQTCEAKKKRNAENNKEQNTAIEVTEDDIILSWEFILEHMTDYHRERNFTPTNILSNYNKILQDIKTHYERIGKVSKAANTATGTTPGNNIKNLAEQFVTG